MAFGNDSQTTVATITLGQGTEDAVLKEIYSKEGITDAFFKKNPFYVMMPKKEDVPGRNYEQSVWASAGQAQSRSVGASVGGPGIFTMANTSGEAPYTFLVPKMQNQAVANISAQGEYEASGSEGSMVDMVKAIVDNQLRQLTRDTALGCFRNQVPVRGQVGGSVAGLVLTLSQKADVLNFELGMFLDFVSSSVAGGTVRALSTATGCYISAIDYSSASMTVTYQGGGTHTLTAQNVAVGDFIVRSGDAGVGATSVALGFNGFNDWIPFGGVTTSDSFLGVNRSANATRLAGSYLDGTGGNLEQVLEQAANQVGQVNGELTHFIMPYPQWTALANSQGSKVQIIDVKSKKTSIGFQGIQIVGVDGPITCIADNTCPANLIAGVNIDTWKMISKKPAVHIYESDGKVWLRSNSSASAFGMEVRFYSLANVLCSAPHNNINVRVTPLS